MAAEEAAKRGISVSELAESTLRAALAETSRRAAADTKAADLIAWVRKLNLKEGIHESAPPYPDIPGSTTKTVCLTRPSASCVEACANHASPEIHCEQSAEKQFTLAPPNTTPID